MAKKEMAKKEIKKGYVITPGHSFVINYTTDEGYPRTTNCIVEKNWRRDQMHMNWLTGKISTIIRDKQDWQNGMSVSGLCDSYCHHQFVCFDDPVWPSLKCEGCREIIKDPLDVQNHCSCMLKRWENEHEDDPDFCNCFKKDK
jgi:hypothetical protein